MVFAGAAKDGFVDGVAVDGLVHGDANRAPRFARNAPRQFLVPVVHDVVFFHVPFRRFACGVIQTAKDCPGHGGRHRGVDHFKAVVDGILQQRPVHRPDVSLPSLHDGQAGGRFPNVLDLDFAEIRVNAPVVVVHLGPLPADALFEAHVFVGAGSGGFFRHEVPTRQAVAQVKARFVVSVVCLAVGAGLVPLGLAADGHTAEAGEPIDKVHGRAFEHPHVQLVIVHDVHSRTRVGPEIVGIGSAAIGIGVVGKGMLHVLGGELAPIVMPLHALA